MTTRHAERRPADSHKTPATASHLSIRGFAFPALRNPASQPDGDLRVQRPPQSIRDARRAHDDRLTRTARCGPLGYEGSARHPSARPLAKRSAPTLRA